MNILYLFECKLHASVRNTPKLGPELGAKFFQMNLKGTLVMHEVTHSDNMAIHGITHVVFFDTSSELRVN